MNKPFTTRELTKRGFVHTPELDFADDGTKFKMFTYKGMPVSYAKHEDHYFIAIRPDYLETGYNGWASLSDEAKKAMDSHNGTIAPDTDRLIESIAVVAKEIGLA